MNNGLLAGIKFGIGVGIGIMAVKETRDAYARYMLKRNLKNLWSYIKNAWKEATEEATEEAQ